MNWGDLRTLIRYKLRDPGEKVWTNTYLLSSANKILEDVTRGSEAHVKHIIWPLTSGTRTVELPEDCFELRDVRINGKKIFGRQAYELEDLDETYLTATGTPEFYYQEDSNTLAFYRVPSWTSAYTGTFDSELGEVSEVTEGSTDWTYTSELGCIIDVVGVDSTKYQIDSIEGIVCALDTAKLVLELSYIYQPAYLVNDSDTPDLPTHYQYLVVYGVLAEAFGKEFQGKNERLEKRYDARYRELEAEWFARSKEWAHGPDQISGQLPLAYGNEQDWSMRVWR